MSAIKGLIEIVGQVLRKFKQEGLHNLTRVELQFISMMYLLAHAQPTQLKMVWENLPYTYQ